MSQKKLFFLALFALGLVISCSKDDGPTTAAKAPTVSGFTPSSGPVGTVFVISGTNFSTTPSKNTVKIGTTTATVSAATATKITTSVPQGATTGKVSVTVGGKTDTGGTFTVTQEQANNEPPVIEAQSFEAAEDIADTGVIATVAASDPEQDALTFSISVNDDDIFEITANGELSLAEGKTLDFETAESHSITVAVTDGNSSATATITINVGDIPEIQAQSFEAAEDIADTDVIGTIVVPNATFTISTNDNDLFEIDASSGELSLAPGKSLDFGVAEEHSITVMAANGNGSTEATITITVTAVYESLADDPASFVTTWVTTANNETIVIGVDVFYTYDYTIDWGDGTVENITNADFIASAVQHEYAQPGTHTVAIKGTFPAMLMDVNVNIVTQADALKLASIEQWGTNLWTSMYYAFAYCGNMVYNATDVPDLSQVTAMNGMFSGAEAFNGDLSGWDVSNVTDMSSVFSGATAFEGIGLSDWNTVSVTDMGAMFSSATAFNGDISDWNVSNVTNMGNMFYGAEAFNGDISGWNTGSVTTMYAMFYQAYAFNRDLGAWDIGSVVYDFGLGLFGMVDMLSYSGLSTANYSSTLEGWANPNAPQNITLDAEAILYCDNLSTAAALNYLTNDKGWTINDGGFVNCN